VVIALIPWCVALGSVSALAGARRALATAGLFALLAGAGLLAYRDHAAFELPALCLALLPVLWLCRPTRIAAPRTDGVAEDTISMVTGARQV
jgi:hypothetical protein